MAFGVSFQSILKFWIGGMGAALATAALGTVAFLPVSWALTVKSDFRKDPATGRMVGFAEAYLPQKPETLWPLLTQAVHGKLSDRTKVCAGLDEATATSLTTGTDRKNLMPIASDQESSLLQKIEAELNPSILSVALGQKGERYVFRKIHVPIPFTSDRWFLAKETHDAQTGQKEGLFRLKIDGVAGNVRFYQSEWTLKPEAQGSSVRIDINSDMGISVPGFLVSLGAKELETSMQRFANMADAGKVE
jgi:hypothetical protein